MASSLKTRLIVAVSALAVTAVVAVAFASRHSTRVELRKLQDLERGASAGRLAAAERDVASALAQGCCSPGALRDASARLGPLEAFIVIDARTRQVVTIAGPAARGLYDVRATVAGEELTLETRSGPGGGPQRLRLRLGAHAGQSVTLSDGRAARVHVVPIPTAEMNASAAAFLGSLDRQMLLVTALVAVVTVALTWLLGSRIVGPIRDLRSATRAVAAGDFSRRVPVRGGDEVAQLGAGFNAMASQLERQQALRRNLMNDIAHELRTPLTALRCRLETIIDGLADDPSRAVKDAHEQLLHVSRLVNDVEELALAEARELRLTLEPLNAASIVESAVRAAGLDGDPRLRLDVPADLVVQGDAGRVCQILLNLMSNADRHTPADGTLSVRVSRAAEEATFEVENTGSFLDDEQLARVFDRFYRAEPARERSTGGRGLGLAIAKQLVEVHGGRVWARRTGEGLVFGFALPVAATREST